MKKRSPTDYDIFQHEESLLHKFSESNSAYIKFSSEYIELPPCPVGNDKIEFGVGDLVKDVKRSFYTTPMVWEILDVRKQNGFASYMCELRPAPTDLVSGKPWRKDRLTKSILHQQNIELVERAIQPKTKKSPSKKKATHKGQCQFCGDIHKLPNGKIAKHQYAQHESAFPDKCPGSGFLPYNQTCSEITTNLIPQIHDRIAEIHTQIENVETETKLFYYSVYHSKSTTRSWEKGELKELAPSEFVRRFEFVFGRSESVPFYFPLDLDTDDAETVAQYHNKVYIKYLQSLLFECRGALTYCQSQVKVWKETRLIAI